ncbi:MAG TPA: Imm50 family immunity protein [Isosphaeraceae bacterium]|nr:Imm50 family immunity protein [Isosphaeraceae bacterium]
MAKGDEDIGAFVTGASKLIDLYGYFPSFHDAVVESILIERDGPTVTIRFTTNDEAYSGGQVREPDQLAIVVIQWSEVSDLRLSGIDRRNWIDGLTFSVEGGSIRSELELMDGIEGFILARRVEIVEVQAEGCSDG